VLTKVEFVSTNSNPFKIKEWLKIMAKNLIKPKNTTNRSPSVLIEKEEYDQFIFIS